jgi:hypothetical protein
MVTKNVRLIETVGHAQRISALVETAELVAASATPRS